MLVLSRGCHQRVVFPSLRVSIEILKISGGRVQIGIEAPKEIPVHRSEVAERIFCEGLHHEPPK
jgi:carbon storage regulator